MIDITERLYIYTISDNAVELAREHGFGLEIAEFCTAYNMDNDFETWNAKVRGEISGVRRFRFHAPFNELCPAAIDPLIVDVSKKRYKQAYDIMNGYGINAMVVHSGYVPLLYFEDWFIEKSIEFWKGFLSDKPGGFCLYLENVLENSPEILCKIVRAVEDNRFKLCLDIGHAAFMGSGTPIVKWIDQMLPFIGHVHLHNNYGDFDTHNALDDGDIDVATVIRKITEAGANTTFTIESFYAKSSVEWLKVKGFLS